MRQDIMSSERTALANERTLLAYVRTALTIFVVGVSFLHFLDGRASVRFFGWLLISSGIGAFVFGMWRFRKVQRTIRKRR